MCTYLPSATIVKRSNLYLIYMLTQWNGPNVNIGSLSLLNWITWNNTVIVFVFVFVITYVNQIYHFNRNSLTITHYGAINLKHVPHVFRNRFLETKYK